MRTTILLACLLVGAPAAAQDRVFTASRIAHAAAQVADLSVTMYGIGAGRVREANPVFAWTSDEPVTFALMKGAGAFGLDYLLRRLRRTHPTAATVTGFVLAGAFTVVVVHNKRE